MSRVFHDIQQNTEEWFALRLGKPTSSKFGVIMANTCNGPEFNVDAPFGTPAIEYAQSLAFERVTGRKWEATFSTPYFDRGHEYEPAARELYEFETFYKVENGGFYEYNGWGDSPDGNIGTEGSLEIKVANEKVMFQTIEKGGYDTAYKWQIQGHMFIGGKKWCDFVRFCPEFYEPKRLYIHRVEKSEQLHGWLEARLKKFDQLIDEKVKILNS